MIEIIESILYVLGSICLTFAFIRMVIIGKKHVDREGPLQFRPMNPDLMEKMDTTLLIGVLGGVLLLLGWGISRFFSP